MSASLLNHPPGGGQASGVVAQRFQIEALAGSGGMGNVYRARDLHDNSLVALKILHLADSSPAATERFAREVRALASLSHPGVVRYVAHGQTPEGFPFLAMEWLEGADLEQVLKQRRLAFQETLVLLRIVTEALSAAHRQGIVHRELLML